MLRWVRSLQQNPHFHSHKAEPSSRLDELGGRVGPTLGGVVITVEVGGLAGDIAHVGQGEKSQ